MKILYIAYSCSPYHGSEDKIGWNIPLESAKTNTVFVITKEEQREYIEEYLKTHEVQNIKFYYVDIPNVFKRMFRGVLYSGRCSIWNRRAWQLAEDICRKENVEVIHQLTPVEFRSIGNYGKIPNTKFVCGPIGGAEAIPAGLRDYASGRMHIEAARIVANWWCRFWIDAVKQLRYCDKLLFANQETREYLKTCLDSTQVGFTQSEIGISEEELSSEAGTNPAVTRFLVVGRMIYRKGHQFLLDALERVPADFNYECVFLGDGAEYDVLKNRVMNHQTFREKIHFPGNVPYREMEEAYNSASVLVMPSIRETTGTVVLEAMARGLPVVTIDQFGAATILNRETGWLYKGGTKEEYIENLKNVLMECIQSPIEVKRRGENARKRAEAFTWAEKMKVYQAVYGNLRKEE